MAKRTRARRHESVLSPSLIKRWSERRGTWYESPEEVEEGLAWGLEKAQLLRWVRKQMRGKLTPRQMVHIELYFFQGMSYSQVARSLGINTASAHRAVKSALRRLRIIAAEQNVRIKRHKPER